MQTIDGHVPLSGPSSDPVLFGVANALSQMFPPVEHPSIFNKGDVEADVGQASGEWDSE